MLIGPAATAPKDSRGLVPRIVGAGAAGFVALQIILVLARKILPRIPVAQAGFGSIEAFGDKLFSDYLVPFEVSSFLLMVAIVGAVAVARGKQPDPQLAEKAEKTSAKSIAEGGAS
jgi:NADH-quinone oxidoreductase subunit J